MISLALMCSDGCLQLNLCSIKTSRLECVSLLQPREGGTKTPANQHWATSDRERTTKTDLSHLASSQALKMNFLCEVLKQSHDVEVADEGEPARTRK